MDRWRPYGAGVAGFHESAAVMTTAAGTVLVLALLLVVTVSNIQTIPTRARAFLLLLAMVAGILAVMQQGR